MEKKLVNIGAKVTPKVHRNFHAAIRKNPGTRSASAFLQAVAETLIAQTDAGEAIAQPLRLLTEEEKVILIRAGYDFASPPGKP